MEELINGLVERVGLSKDKAEQVVSFLKENASKVPDWLGSDQVKDIAKKVPGLGGLL